MEGHSRKVQEIAEQVSRAYAGKKKIHISHGFSHSTREISFQGKEVVDISGLNEVLEVNTAKRYAWVEPAVTMEQLVSESLKNGLVPLVVPELPKITVGGAIAGGAGESSSFEYGGVHSVCEEYEVILGNGEIVKASPIVAEDLFWGMPCSYGSLGITTLAKVRLRPAKPFVQLMYLPAQSFSELLEVINLQMTKDIDYIDAIIFSPTNAVVMVGQLAEEPADISGTVTFSEKRDEWFYLHVLEKKETRDFGDDLIPVTDYFFRYNRGGFWAGKYVFDELKVPFTRFTRSLFDTYLNAKSLGKALRTSNRSQSVICQDFCLPSDHIVEFLNYLHTRLKAYPLWICPLKPSQEPDGLSPVHLPVRSVINIGVYIRFSGSYEDFLTTNRDLEKKLMQHHGRKVLYAHQYFTPEEFWQIYDFGWYSALRDKYFATDVFPDVYESTHVNKKYQTRSVATFLSFLRKAVFPSI